jgi:hypothetical protein
MKDPLHSALSAINENIERWTLAENCGAGVWKNLGLAAAA